MDLRRLIEGLSRPEAYPFPVERVDVVQTHISVVFLAGDRAFKVKKPLVLDFLDYGTLGRRRHFCEEEVRLNGRRAPDVYLGVVPIVRKDGGPVFAERQRSGGRGRPIEYAVEMRRLPDSARLSERVVAGGVAPALAAQLGERVASFHRDAERSPRIASFARFEAVAKNVRDNYAAAEPMAGEVLGGGLLARLAERGEAELRRLRPLIEARAERGLPCDAHGDLRLEHVYHFPDRPAPFDLVAIDGIEFNERFRFIDPICDMAFLHMDLMVFNRRDLAAAYSDHYFHASGDEEGRALLPFYTSYRAAVRGKVQGMKARQEEVPAPERERARGRAGTFWLLALSAIEPPERKPCLLLVAGLPGTGKTTLARALAARAGFTVIRTDVVRKERPGLVAEAPGSGAFGEGRYAAHRTGATYAETLRRSEAVLFDGGRVLVDASFREEERRAEFRRAAEARGVPFAILHCVTAPEIVRERLAARRSDASEASDADWPVYVEMARRWEPFATATRDAVIDVDTSASTAEAAGRALAALHALSLWSG